METIRSADKKLHDNILRKQKERLDAAMPFILEGYCSKSSQSREIAEQEAKEFLQIIEDSASYQFGYNHSIAYCLLGYYCAYYRYYHPIEFITSFLNNAANEDDIKNGTAYARKIGIKVTSPKWGVARSEYFYDKERNTICKGMESIKYMNASISDELYEIAHTKDVKTFMDVLREVQNTSLNSRQLEILIKIDFFSEFGNQRELLRMVDIYYNTLDKGNASKISKTKAEASPIEDIIAKYSNNKTKAGGIAKSYTILDMNSIMREVEDKVKSVGMEDLGDLIKVQNFKEYMGYVGYVSEKEEDRPKLFVMNIYPLHRKKDGKQFGYSIVTKSIGSGKESRFTVFNNIYDKEPIKENDIILCVKYETDGQYFTLRDYRHIYA